MSITYSAVSSGTLSGFPPRIAPLAAIQSVPRSQFLNPNPFSRFGFSSSLQGSIVEFRLKLSSRVVLSKERRVLPLVVRNDRPQNEDLPKQYARREKKPFPVPIVDLRRAARERVKNNKDKPKRPLPPPKNGMVVKSLVPLAYKVYNARIRLINNLHRLMKVVRVNACGWCNEIHVGPYGHPFKSCKGPNASQRKGLHEWTNSVIEDVIVPLEAYHLYDRLGKRIRHDERFSIPRVPAVVELCIQGGVEIPEFPTKRRRKPIIRIGKSEFVDADETELPDPEPQLPPVALLTELPVSEITPPSSEEEMVSLAEETLQAWEEMRAGAKKLMRLYRVRVCGYCPEVHVGPTGHKAQNCGAFKHQQRNGQHGWQSAVLDDLIPPRYVWHVPDVNGPPLQRELRSFYGQAPAVVEICAQAGAVVPEQYRATMRLEVGIPSSVKEAEMVV
ncbi:PREDICTED: APO protein 2, chloroplastic-like [Camelina sativa]|uniref:APO protein 2, chloroplastic-like n=1 Tax=Camelina sativa TaxID=90675 RepID=A0ABM0V9I0_CAMSA|nr:PREDICTED: APO protein 2, chloroplastic-like [Camelina sativa]